ncbi:MAG: CvpA family protein [Woeseiaceae bacterium]|jgi:membrane protein required for colicin V production|nr:CvpA family protein [Woeseiaceae bacterium]
MPIIDIIIAVALAVSIIIGFVRGFVKEAISIATLVIAIWASLYFGPVVGGFADSWLSSVGMQTWFGRILVFAIILSVGGLLGWGISKFIRLSMLGGIDRLMGSIFGVIRGILLAALFIIGGQYSGFDNDDWWKQSRLLPHFEVVADWIKVMAPKGYELIIPDEIADALPVQLPVES